MDCDCELQIGDWPYHPHGRELGMLGEFHEYDDLRSYPTPTHIDSLAQRNRLERQHGLEPLSRNDAERIAERGYHDNLRREMREWQSTPPAVRAREAAIREALQKHRR